MVGEISKNDAIEHAKYGKGIVTYINDAAWVTVRFEGEADTRNIRAYPPHDLDILKVNGQIFSSEYAPAPGHSWRVSPKPAPKPINQLIVDEAAKQDFRKPHIDSTIGSTLTFNTKNPPKELSTTERKHLIQNNIRTLRYYLDRELTNNNTVEATELRHKLVDQRIEFYKLDRFWTPNDLEQLRVRYIRQTEGDNGVKVKYKSWCWVCGSPIADGTNDKCTNSICGWYICACGACLCPDWKDNTEESVKHVRQSECEGQRERLGFETYEKLLQERLGPKLYAQLQDIRQSRRR